MAKTWHFLAGKEYYLTLSTKIAISNATTGTNTIFKFGAAINHSSQISGFALYELALHIILFYEREAPNQNIFEIL